MSLTPEWADRVKKWREVLSTCLYRPIAPLALQGFTTREQLTPDQARRRRFRPMPAGTKWGGKWEYAWFRCRVRVPRSGGGRRIVAQPAQGGEGLAWVDGVETGTVSRGRPQVLLTRRARGGETFDLLVEAYAGHGPTPCDFGPVKPGVLTVPEPPAAQQTVGDPSFGVWEEEAFQLWMDVETLWSLRSVLDPNSLRLAEVDAALRDFTTIVDFELPHEEMLKTVAKARKRLASALACRNGSTAPALCAFGHGHLDVAWLWPLAETERKSARTLANQLVLCAEYPAHRFLQSQPHVYAMVKRLYPKLYARVRRAVKAGGIVPEGGMWVEPDMNISSGESLIRQCIHGKRFFREEFGVESELLWLPDVFGYSAALPQILRGCGIKYFATAKIFWTYHGGDRFPLNTFDWEGIDGTTVLAHLFDSYGGPGNPESAARRWEHRSQKDGISGVFLCYGHGDGGGGPTRDHVESVLRIRDLEGCPRVRIESPVAFFRRIERQGAPARYVGELYFQAHRGTYTSQARTKKGNRRSELALREAELWAVAASQWAGRAVPRERFDAMWKKVLLNQFHDILPGSSIARVYAEAEQSYGEVIAESGRIAAAARSALTVRGRALTVFNSLNWERSELVELPAGWRGAADAAGQTLPVQKRDGRTLAEVSVPSCGWTTIRPGAAVRAAEETVSGSDRVLENGLLRVRFNDGGEVTSVFDKEADREWTAGPCNRFRMFQDVPSVWDAWDLDSCYKSTPVELQTRARVEVAARGPLAAALRITRKIHDSTLTQVVTLRRGSRRLDFETRMDWHESHKVLKVAFPLAVYADHALHEIQFGHVQRPNHGSRPYDADRFEVAQQKWTALVEPGRGAAVLNDCKYGVNVTGNSINLTLLKAPKAPDMHADQGVQEFTYSLYVWNGGLADSGLVRESYELNCPVTTAAGAGGQKSLFQVDAPGVVIEAMKPAEDGSGDVVVRMWESKRTATHGVFRTALPVRRASETDMLERARGPLAVKGGAIRLDFRPFEIKTIRMKMG